MKKIFFLISAIVVCLNMVAAIQVNYGQKELKAALVQPAVCVVEFDWANALYDEDEPIEKRFENNTDDVKKDCENKFMMGFNQKTKGMLLKKSSNGAKFRLIITIINMDRGFNPAGFIPRYDATSWVKFELKSIETNEIISMGSIDKIKGKGDVNLYDCFGKSFFKVGQTLSQY